jgi:hypothetical protein
MTDLRRDRPPASTLPAATLWQPRSRQIRELRAALASVLLCAGLMILPALAALDLGVALECRNLDRGPCVALVVHFAQ